jgi:hypothetical protein
MIFVDKNVDILSGFCNLQMQLQMNRRKIPKKRENFAEKNRGKKLVEKYHEKW